MSKILGANWQTTVSGIGTAIFSILTGLAALPYTMGDLATIIPPEYKAKVFFWSAIATAVLKVWNSIQQKSKNVTGGSVQQTVNGAVADPGTQSLVDRTVVASIQSGETVTPEQKQAVQHII
jgi:hypothetical protein